MTKIYEGPRVLTIQDPFGTLIAQGKKKIETRSWNTKYRGKLLIHVAKKLWISPDLMEEAGRENVARNLGHIIAEADLNLSTKSAQKTSSNFGLVFIVSAGLLGFWKTSSRWTNRSRRKVIWDCGFIKEIGRCKECRQN